MASKRSALLRGAGLLVWSAHLVVARLGVYRCPRCRGRLNYRWWCKSCQGYRLPAR